MWTPGPRPCGPSKREGPSTRARTSSSAKAAPAPSPTASSPPTSRAPYARDVLRLFVGAGAPEEILWQAKPHIGTDLLRGVVKRLRGQIEEMGGQVRFLTQLVGLDFEGGAVSGVRLAPSGFADGRGEASLLATDTVVLACGHSARDTFAMLHRAGASMEPKPFSVGVRIEHPQALVDRAQYGPFAGHGALGPADYKLSVQLPATASDGPRGVYTFCMCPGGEVVCASSEPDSVVVNGMSLYARDGENANSALLVGVDPRDFGSSHVLAGVEFQRRIEQAAYRCALAAGGAPYSAPAQTVRLLPSWRSAGRGRRAHRRAQLRPGGGLVRSSPVPARVRGRCPGVGVALARSAPARFRRSRRGHDRRRDPKLKPRAYPARRRPAGLLWRSRPFARGRGALGSFPLRRGRRLRGRHHERRLRWFAGGRRHSRQRAGVP